MIRELILRWLRKPSIVVYVSGPMTGKPQLNYPAFHAAAASLRASGYRVVNPAEINADPSAGWEACMRADIAALMDCTHIALLPGWEQSRGAKLERHIADHLGMRQIYLTSEAAWTAKSSTRARP